MIFALSLTHDEIPAVCDVLASNNINYEVIELDERGSNIFVDEKDLELSQFLAWQLDMDKAPY